MASWEYIKRPTLPRKEGHAVLLVPSEKRQEAWSVTHRNLDSTGYPGPNRGEEPQVRAAAAWEEVLQEAGLGRFPSENPGGPLSKR